MHDETIESFELRLASCGSHELPADLRDSVLINVQHELRAARWDSRLARAAAVMLVVGVGVNAGTSWYSGRSRGTAMAGGPARDSLVRTAVIVAEATDASTARRYARQFSALRGRQLSSEDAAAIDAAVERATLTAAAREHKG